MKQFFKGIRKKEQGNKFVTEDIKRHTEDDSPKYLQTLEYRFFAYAQNDVINKTLTNLFPYFPIPFFLKKKNGNKLIDLSTYRPSIITSSDRKFVEGLRL